MYYKAAKRVLLLGVGAQLMLLVGLANVAHAQRHDRDRYDRYDDRRDHDGRYRDRHEQQREHERRRREDAKAKGVVIGVVGTAVLAGVIAAAANRQKEKRERADDCLRRHGNHDSRTDTYRAADGYRYPCR